MRKITLMKKADKNQAVYVDFGSKASAIEEMIANLNIKGVMMKFLIKLKSADFKISADMGSDVILCMKISSPVFTRKGAEMRGVSIIILTIKSLF